LDSYFHKEPMNNMKPLSKPYKLDGKSIKWESCESSNIKAYFYNKENCFLLLQFHGGRVYQYLDVPNKIYLGLKRAKSKGKYVWKNIRDRYITFSVEITTD
jgi:hypothetical protein